MLKSGHDLNLWLTTLLEAPNFVILDGITKGVAVGIVIRERAIAKHDLSEERILQAWRNPVKSARRDRVDGRVDYLVVGFDSSGRAIEIVAEEMSNGLIVIYHADSPPRQRMMKELGLIR